MPVFAPDDVRGAAALRLGPFLDLRDRGADDALFDRLPVAVELFETIREAACLVGVLRQEELQGGARMAEPSCRVDSRPEPEADLARIDRRGIDVRRLQQRAQPGLLRARERPQARDHERAVLAHERNDVGDRRERDEVEMTAEHFGVGSEQRLAELVDHARAAEIGKRIVRRSRGDDGAIGQLVAGTVMVGDDHVEPELACASHLVDRCDAAVDGEDEPAAFFGETLERSGR